jgi:hypothetical protein
MDEVYREKYFTTPFELDDGSILELHTNIMIPDSIQIWGADIRSHEEYSKYLEKDRKNWAK